MNRGKKETIEAEVIASEERSEEVLHTIFVAYDTKLSQQLLDCWGGIYLNSETLLCECPLCDPQPEPGCYCALCMLRRK